MGNLTPAVHLRVCTDAGEEAQGGARPRVYFTGEGGGKHFCDALNDSRSKQALAQGTRAQGKGGRPRNFVSIFGLATFKTH